MQQLTIRPSGLAEKHRQPINSGVRTTYCGFTHKGREMKKLVAAAAVVAMLSGCATVTPARYSMSANNNVALREYSGAKVELVSLASAPDPDQLCRMGAYIETANGEPISEFVRNAFNSEFKFAQVYSTFGTKLRGKLTEVQFSSSSGLTHGWWQLGINLTSSNGVTMSKTSKTNFKSGFVGVAACNNTAQALGSAVQDLIHAVVTDPKFKLLIK